MLKRSLKGRCETPGPEVAVEAIGFWGVCASRPLPHKNSLEVHYLGLDRKQSAVAGPSGSGDF